MVSVLEALDRATVKTALVPSATVTELMPPSSGSSTLVMVGAEDLPFLAPSEEMARRIPGATRVTIPDAAHSPQLENPAAWSASIRAHLERSR